VATASFEVIFGGDALIGVSASAWSQTPGMMSMGIWLDGQPTGTNLQMYANVAEMHMSLGHAWAWCRALTPGQHTLMLVAGATTVTDENDYACATVWQMGDGCAVRFSDDLPCPSGTGKQLMGGTFRTDAKQVMVSASTSGWVTQGQGTFVGGALSVDGQQSAALEVCANNLNQHLAMVPTDLIAVPDQRGQHTLKLSAAGNTSTDGGDMAHLTVVELLRTGPAPTLALESQNVEAQSQQGDGKSIYFGEFPSGGGTLLVRVSVSVWTQQLTGLGLWVGIQLDGTSRGYCGIYPNFTETHMTAITNDLVVSGIPAGQHTLNLLSERAVITDYNDRVSVTVMEFPS
jgi:hypothetical protein